MAAANVALANDTVTRPIRVNERASERIERSGRLRLGHGPTDTGADSSAVTADMASAACHGGHGLRGPSVPERGHDPDVTVITARTCGRGHGSLYGVAAADDAESRLARRVTAGTDGHGQSRGVCRRRVRGDVLTYQGTGLRPAGETLTYREGKENGFDSITFGPKLNLPMFRAKKNACCLFGE